MSETQTKILVSLPAPIWEPYNDDDSIKWNSSAHSATGYGFYWINLRSFRCFQTGESGRAWCISGAIAAVGSLDEAKAICWRHYLSELGATEA